MKKLNGYEKVNLPKSKKEYYVMLNDEIVAKTKAVSADKAVNNVRWNYFISEGIYDYSMEDFDAVEV